jgi:IS30 family transposase
MDIKQRGLTPRQKDELWARWKCGETLSEIAEALSKSPGSVFGSLRQGGGIAPKARTRAPRQLDAFEREEISRGLVAGESVRSLARQLGRAASTISREIARNGGSDSYRAGPAEHRAWQSARRPKPCRLATNERLRSAVASKLQQDWSPQQISGWLRTAYDNEPKMQVSHETIYRSLFIQARGVLKKELISHLRSRRSMRRAKTATSAKQQGLIVDAVSIRERPAEVEDRAIPGHWEGDLLAGAGNSHIATLVERHSRYTVLVHVKGKDTSSVVDALVRQVRRLPAQLVTTLTWDRGAELAQHKRFTVATDVQVYFCDPRSPWQRGTNENTNGLLRQYFPKGTDLSGYTQRQLDAVAKKLNTRPRMTLGFATPADTLAAWVLR